uniref:Uncharacterized protein n=1 Tax=Anguilla anguilla TaxID=7936 RepID=A0A0E9UPN0_ANGAN
MVRKYALIVGTLIYLQYDWS